MFGRKKPPQPEQAAAPKSMARVGALWLGEDGKAKGVLLDGLRVGVFENDYKKTDKDPDYKLVAYIGKNTTPSKAVRDAFNGLDVFFKSLGIDPDKVFAEVPASATPAPRKDDDVPF